MPKVSTEHLEERRDHILDVAAGCFAREGFHATSMADLITATGLSAGSMYRYFKNKDDLIAAIIDRYLEGLIDEFGALGESTSDPGEAVSTAIEIISGRFQSSDAVPLTHLLPQVWSEAMRNGAIHERGRLIYQTLLGILADVVRRGQAQGKVRPELVPESVANVMLSLVQGYILQGMLLRDAVDSRKYGETVRQLFSTT